MLYIHPPTQYQQIDRSGWHPRNSSSATSAGALQHHQSFGGTTKQNDGKGTSEMSDHLLHQHSLSKRHPGNHIDSKMSKSKDKTHTGESINKIERIIPKGDTSSEVNGEQTKFDYLNSTGFEIFTSEDLERVEVMIP